MITFILIQSACGTFTISVWFMLTAGKLVQVLIGVVPVFYMYVSACQGLDLADQLVAWPMWTVLATVSVFVLCKLRFGLGKPLQI